MMNEPLLKLELPGVKKLKSGKVREVFDLGDRLLFVATDRISAFDCVMPNGIPRKGEVLTQISYFWFGQTANIVANHLAANAGDPLPAELQQYSALLERRSMVVKKAQPLAIECVVRGYLSGSGWKDYQKTGCVCGIKLPPGLQDSSRLPEPLFTPATKAETGHDENISFEEACEITGREIAGTGARSEPEDLFLRRRLRPASAASSSPTRNSSSACSTANLILIDEVLDARFLPLLAGGQIRGRPRPAELRQAIRARLPGNAVMEQTAARARPCRRMSSPGRRRNIWRPTRS